MNSADIISTALDTLANKSAHHKCLWDLIEQAMEKDKHPRGKMQKMTRAWHTIYKRCQDEKARGYTLCQKNDIWVLFDILYDIAPAERLRMAQNNPDLVGKFFDNPTQTEQDLYLAGAPKVSDVFLWNYLSPMLSKASPQTRLKILKKLPRSVWFFKNPMASDREIIQALSLDPLIINKMSGFYTEFRILPKNRKWLALALVLCGTDLESRQRIIQKHTLRICELALAHWGKFWQKMLGNVDNGNPD